MSKVFVTGMGAITPLGNSVADNREALKQGKSGLSSIQLFATKYAGLLPFGEIKISNEALKEALHVTAPGVTRTSLLGLYALNEALHNSGITRQQLQQPSTAFIGATTVGGMCLTDELYMDANKNEVGSQYLSSYDISTVMLFLEKHYGFSGIISTLNTACSSSANAIMYGTRLIKNGLAQRAVVGGVDSLAKFTINGFNSLNILSSQPCRPFDAARNGLNLGEGAAWLVLESEEICADKKKYAEVSGYANTNDAFHPSSLSENGEGPYLAMQQALQIAAISAGQIGYINAHGTGTENNDEVESKAMQRLFGTPPAFTSTKSNIGHTLGAAGAIEAVFSLLCLLHNEIYPALNFANPIPATALRPETTYRQTPLEHVMSNSFGFGGNCSSLIFSKAT